MKNNLISLSLAIFIIALTGCANSFSVPEEETQIPDILPAPPKEKIIELCDKSELIFIGKVRFVGQSAGAFSGTDTFYQLVVYQGINILKGGYLNSDMPVLHLIVGGRTVNKKAALRPDIFRTGAKMIIFAIFKNCGIFDKKYPVFPVVFDDNYGVIQHTDELEKNIVEYLKKSGSLSELYEFFNSIDANDNQNADESPKDKPADGK